MKRFIIHQLVLAFLLVSFTCHAKNTRLVVSPGSALPDVQSALDAAMKIRLRDPLAEITIFVEPGDYYLNSIITVPASLNGLTIAGPGKGQARIKGSTPLKAAWEKFNENIFVASVDAALDFDQLFMNGQKQILARYPNYNENGGHWQGHAADALSKDRILRWKKPAGTIIHAMHGNEWGEFHYVISRVNPDGTFLYTGGHQNKRPAPMHKLYRMVENVFEELDSPGEWFLDRDVNKLYYWPAQGTDIKTAKFEAVTLRCLLNIAGDEKSPVKNITIQGLSFEQSHRTFMETYEPLLRSDWTIYRGGAVFIQGAENCSVKGCEFNGLGGNAIFISGYNRDIVITGNHIHDCGASGICFVGDPSAVRSPSFQYSDFVETSQMDTIAGPKNNLYPKSCIAGDNLIYRTGRIEKQTAGIEISMSMDIVVSHNSIYEVPRAGINIGDGTWGGHVLEFNDVFNTVLESGDHGSFNSWGRDRYWHPDRRILDSLALRHPSMIRWDAIHTTIIRNNRFRCDHGWDIDLDDGSSNYEIYNNLCLNGGLKLREGFYRTVENNIMVNNGFHPHVWFLNSDDVFRRNIMMAPHADIMLSAWGKEVDFNLFPDEEALLKARINGVDMHSTAGNPGFMNAALGDYSVENGSPAIKLGFKNFTMNNFGVVSLELKKIAKSPEIPPLILFQPVAEGANSTKIWLGVRIKNVETLGEQSAAGIGKIAGILVLEGAPGNSGASQLRKGDIILKGEGKEVVNIKDLLRIHQQVNWTGNMDLVIFRNQKEQEIRVSTK